MQQIKFGDYARKLRIEFVRSNRMKKIYGTGFIKPLQKKNGYAMMECKQSETGRMKYAKGDY